MLTISTWGYWADRLIVTNKKISVSGYNKIVCEVKECFFNQGGHASEAQALPIMLLTSASASASISKEVRYYINSNKVPNVVELELSGVSGEFHIGCDACNGANLSISRMYLTK